MGQTSRIAGALALAVLTANACTSSRSNPPAVARRADSAPRKRRRSRGLDGAGRAAWFGSPRDFTPTPTSRAIRCLFRSCCRSSPRRESRSTEIVYPEPQDLRQEGADQPLAVFEREFLDWCSAGRGAGRAARRRGRARRLRYQACDEKVCYPPVTLTTTWNLRVVRRSAKVAATNAARMKGIRFGHGEPPPPPTGAAYPAAAAIDDDVRHARARNGWRGSRIFRSAAPRTTWAPPTSSSSSGTPRRASKKRACSRIAASLAILLLVLLGGLALNLTPCVLPMIPINLAIIGAGAQAGSRARGFFLGATYGAAMALVYGVLGLIVILTAGTFGTINSIPWFNLGIAVALRRPGARDVRRAGDRFLAVLHALQRRQFGPRDISRRLQHGCGRGVAGRRLRGAGRHSGRAVLEQPLRDGHARPPWRCRSSSGWGWRCRGQSPAPASPPCLGPAPGWSASSRSSASSFWPRPPITPTRPTESCRIGGSTPNRWRRASRRSSRKAGIRRSARTGRGQTRSKARAHRFLGHVVQELPRDGQDDVEESRGHCRAANPT